MIRLFFIYMCNPKLSQITHFHSHCLDELSMCHGYDSSPRLGIKKMHGFIVVNEFSTQLGGLDQLEASIAVLYFS